MGCVPPSDDGDENQLPSNPSNPTNPTPPPPPPPPPPPICEDYALTSTFDVTAEALIPGPAYDALQLVRGVRQDPAGTMFMLLDEAGVPIIGTIRDLLPGVLEDKLEDWMNDALTQVGIADELDFIIAMSETTLTKFDLESELVLDPTSGNRTSGVHHARSLRFHPPELDDVVVTLPVGLVLSPVTVERESMGQSHTLVLGTHSFSLGFGQYAYAGLEAIVEQRTGGSLREWLSTVAQCPVVAQAVASRCILSACVGHAEELEELCEKGLDKVAEEIRDRFVALDYEAIRFEEGRASLTTSGLGNGVWQAQIDVGQGLRSVPATFTGVMQ
jgi:hypothetical protein